MGLIILILAGSVLGWLSSIILKIEDTRTIAFDAAAGAIGALAVGVAVNNGSLINSLSAGAFLFACLGAIGAIALTNVVRETA